MFNLKKIRQLLYLYRCISFAKCIYTYFLYIKSHQKSKIKNINPKSISHINSFDCVGGAAKVANNLFEYQNRNDWDSHLYVEQKQGQSNKIHLFKKNESKKQMNLYVAEKGLQWQYLLNLSSFDFINSDEFNKTNIFHFHNLHSWNGYFSPFTLPLFSSNKKVVWTLHDMHAITGHCAHSFECKKWQSGCGSCPHLDIYPKLTKDTTAFLWKTKKSIYKKCDMQIVVPSKWLYNLVKQSILGHLPCTLIYNGIDTDIFYPKPKSGLKEKYGIRQDTFVVLYAADLGTANPFKGGEYVQKLIQSKWNDKKDIVFITLGGGQTITKQDNVWTFPYVQSEEKMAEFYSLSDVYLYPSLADNCPLVILEAMACGLPVLTFETGGIPELVIHNETGYIANYKDLDDLLLGFHIIYENHKLRAKMSEQAIIRINEQFTLEMMCQKYLDLYNSIL